MRAVRVLKPGHAELVEIDRPHPGRGEVLLKVAAAGVCHSDVLLRQLPAELHMPQPVTLGHETAGWIEEMGEGVEGLEIGQLVAVYGLLGCGSCVACRRGDVNLCRKGFTSMGVHYDGGLADYMVIPASCAVDASGLEPAVAATLTDAGLTSYHAVAVGLAKQPDARFIVILGIGGLGHLAVQAAVAKSDAQIIAVDVDSAKLEMARALGAHHTVVSGPNATQELLDIAGGREIDLAIDLVGVQATVDMCAAVAAAGASIVLVGLGGGKLETVASPTGTILANTTVEHISVGGRAHLEEVLRLARDGKLHVEVEEVAIDDAVNSIDRLDQGGVAGRIVVVAD